MSARPEAMQVQDQSGLSRQQIHHLKTSHTLSQFIDRLRCARERDLNFKKAYVRLLHNEMHRSRNRL